MDVTLIHGASTLSLTDGTVARLLGLDGTGEAPVHRIEERGPQQHGATDIDFRLDPRTVQLALWIKGASQADLETKRKQLIDAFRATVAAKALRFTLDNGEVYQLDGHSTGSLTMPQEGGEGFVMRVGLTFRAADPTFYDPEATTLTYYLGGSAGTASAVPTVVPTFVGASILNVSESIEYEGTWRAYPRIQIHGPISGPKITNSSGALHEVLEFSGVNIPTGEIYTVDLRYGYKTVTDSAGTSKITELTNASDLATWHLADDSEVTDGVNTLLVTGTAATGATRIDIIYNARYVGI
ncbi:MAG: phage tail domain-containing protein [Anaerovoracaceae bacterium]|jgi:hypothetical protein